MFFAGLKLFAQFGQYLHMEAASGCCRAFCSRFSQSPQAEPHFFKIQPLLVRLYLHSRSEDRRQSTNHIYNNLQIAIFVGPPPQGNVKDQPNHHNCNNNYHSLRVCGPRGKHQPDKQKTLHSENFFLQLLTPPTEETNGGPTG